MFRKTKSFLVLTFILTAALLTVACGAKPNNTEQEVSPTPTPSTTAGPAKGDFLIGVIPASGTSNMKTGADKLAAILSEKLGRNVKAEVYPDYNGVVEAMGAGKVQMAYLGPLTYVEAHERYDVKAIATVLVSGQPFYYSYMIAHKDSPYNSFDDIKANAANIRFAFGDISSTSGSLVPGIALKKAELFKSQQDSKFKSITYTGAHDATALAVQNKTQDVGAIDSAIFDNLVKNGKIDGSQFKIIWKSEQLFQYPFAVEKTVPEADIKKIQEAMFAITDKDILSAFNGASAFTAAKNEDYAAIRQAAIEDSRVKPKQ
ncbi:phosphate/phosphite/phosphonate ABC transporter substrate-binding protein [Paenibacillus chartarius]|uniref:Phosphate/phosphite/phosphonate ABC transporter substrate-binding protein n=1 Tax=Paenibacillus chartarius TaxID=747481 RepID=A0ABV6DI82_9BACL